MGAPGEERWRRDLLPVMVSALVIGAIVFAAVSVLQFHALDRQLASGGAMAPLPAPPALDRTPEDFRYGVAVALEQQAVARRYDLALGMLRSRLWTRMMGFTAGMVFGLVGAAFILGRLSEPESQLKGSGAGVSVALKSSSPGLLLAALGAMLMMVSIMVSPTVKTDDGAIYLPPVQTLGQASDAPPPPAPFPEGKQ